MGVFTGDGIDAFSLGGTKNCGSKFSQIFSLCVCRWTWSEPARGEERCGGVPAKVLRFDQLQISFKILITTKRFSYDNCNSKQMM